MGAGKMGRGVQGGRDLVPKPTFLGKNKSHKQEKGQKDSRATDRTWEFPKYADEKRTISTQHLQDLQAIRGISRAYTKILHRNHPRKGKTWGKERA